MATECMFCGGRPTTREHIWPAWLKGYLPLPGGGVALRQGPVGAERIRWVMKTLDQTAKVVCGSCNHGWMSDLEAQVSPIVGPVTANPTAPFSLPIETRRIVARWCVKTTLVVQTALMKGRKAAYVPADHLRWLPANEDPPAGTHVWVFLRHPVTNDGAFDFAFATAFSSAAIRPPGSDVHSPVLTLPDQPEAYIATFAVGYLGFHVFGQDRPRQGEEHRLISVEQIGALGRILVPIWPADQRVNSWPPRFILGPSDLDRLSTWGMPANQPVGGPEPT